MVVVVIIGVLVAIAVPVYNSVTDKSEKSAIQANLRTIDGAISAAVASEDAAAVDTLAKVTALMPTYLQGGLPTEPGAYAITGTEGDVSTYHAQVTTTGEAGIDAGSYTLADLP